MAPGDRILYTFKLHMLTCTDFWQEFRSKLAQNIIVNPGGLEAFLWLEMVPKLKWVRFFVDLNLQFVGTLKIEETKENVVVVCEDVFGTARNLGNHLITKTRVELQVLKPTRHG